MTKKKEAASQLIVVQRPRQNSWVAGQIAMKLAANPESHSVPELSSEIGVPTQQIMEVINSYDGSFSPPRLVGPGCGGNWVLP